MREARTAAVGAACSAPATTVAALTSTRVRYPRMGSIVLPGRAAGLRCAAQGQGAAARDAKGNGASNGRAFAAIMRWLPPGLPMVNNAHRSVERLKKEIEAKVDDL